MSTYKWGESIGEFNGMPIYGGDCWNQMPAVYIVGTEKTGGRYAKSEEEWEVFGAHLPDEVTVLKDHTIRCEEYQALVASGLAVRECTHCPMLGDIDSSEA